MDQAEAMYRAQAVAEACCTHQMDLDAISSGLAGAGMTRIESEVAVELVATAFAWTLMRTMGVARFPTEFRLTRPGAEDVVLDVAGSRLFTAASTIANNIFDSGYTPEISKDGVTAITAYSAEVSALSDALHDDPGLDLSDVSFDSVFFGFEPGEFADAAGYAPGTSVEPERSGRRRWFRRRAP